MVIDTSAIVAILFNESDADVYEDALGRASLRQMGSPTLLECAMVVEGRYGEAGGRELDLLVYQGRIDIVSFTPEMGDLARRAFRRFGKGRHPAGLNFGDCLSYALAAATNQPLLFKGDDFPHTDVASALH